MEKKLDHSKIQLQKFSDVFPVFNRYILPTL